MKSPRLPWQVWVFAGLFLFKALIFAFWITPLWDTPDETGHFAYARAIFSGRGIEPLGKAMIDSDIMTHVRGETAHARENWIAQHPPLFYLIAGLFWKAATWMTDDQEILFRAPRVLSAIFGALALLFIFKIAFAAGLSKSTSLGIMAGFACIPMFTWLSSGTSHDTMVAFLGTASAYYFLLYFKKEEVRHAWMSALLMSLCALTKMSGLVALAPLTFILLVELYCSQEKRFRNIFILLVSASVLPSIWLLRNILAYGNPFQSNFISPIKHIQVSVFDYLGSQPVLEHLYINYFGWIGWIGTGKGSHVSFQMDSPYLNLYAMVTLSLVALSFVWYLRTMGGQPNRTLNKEGRGRRIYFFLKYQYDSFSIKNMGIIVLVIIVSIALALRTIHADFAFMLLPLFALLFAVLGISLYKCFDGRGQAMPFAGANFIVIVSAAVLIVKLHEMYEIFLVGSALQGRYFYMLNGFILLAFVIPACKILKERASFWVLAAAITVCITELFFMFNKVMPFVNWGVIK